MLKRNWRHLLFLALLVALGIGLALYSRTGPQAQLEHRELADGSALTLASPAGTPQKRVILLLPPEQTLSDSDLLALAEGSNARIARLSLPEKGCSAQQQRFQAASQQLGGEPDLVAGIGQGGAFAWRWLAGQAHDNARALSVGFSLQHPDCTDALPQKAEHGHWTIAWNDNPDDASARFARSQSNAETLIGAYDTPLPQLLLEQLRSLLQGQGEAMPVVEVPAAQHGDTVTLFYSGDGGWRDLDRDVAAEMAKRGYAVVGIDALRYFWQHKSPQQGARDLSQLMQLYREKWGAKRFILAGYSFGADVLPAFYNQLKASDQQQVDAILLLALARSGNFEIEVQGWLGKVGAEAATGPELLKLPGAKLLCVYGSEEAAESGCTLPNAPGELLQLPGGHHYDGNYPALAERLLQGIRQRQKN
ncbi:virulence factor family protein [Aquipseudomonas ullengensis]|uniref:Virulence factor family protein n=1 Tax=Aquipseudomonas ullengensis TaxID=2759166 RepID=A0A7W4LQE2_9GAMM|nr:virulence factor family protein [Pseudomonas ullengensis]MBB2497270.1 virulence factor family protein [Pseudomonas ullengensis]